MSANILKLQKPTAQLNTKQLLRSSLNSHRRVAVPLQHRLCHSSPLEITQLWQHFLCKLCVVCGCIRRVFLHVIFQLTVQFLESGHFLMLISASHFWTPWTFPADCLQRFLSDYCTASTRIWYIFTRSKMCLSNSMKIKSKSHLKM